MKLIFQAKIFVSKLLFSEVLREMSEPLFLRRLTKHHLSRMEGRPGGYQGQSMGEVGRSGGFWLRRQAQKASANIFGGSDSMKLWAGDIKKIEGLYGSGVGTYFRLLRFMLAINLVALFIRLGKSVCLPKIISFCFPIIVCHLCICLRF